MNEVIVASFIDEEIGTSPISTEIDFGFPEPTPQYVKAAKTPEEYEPSQTALPTVEREKKPPQRPRNRQESQKGSSLSETGCPMSFARHSLLTNHAGTHTEVKSYTCPTPGCTQTFLSQVLLFDHNHTHAKPFACQVTGCTKRFIRHGRLVGHNRVHTGERPYACQVMGCDKSYRARDLLTRHNRTHLKLRATKSLLD
ncbi:hypothetical protein B0J13DRAFT_459510 [Dactylonectria estremocensis]|uniref:C2H2-type domain-containing protein n=1 Tax=Dactylonectria estremocensis TaxID=1079267 RepID=A0A9P9IDD7_9HYPO|nr:hypothetical protein B0J13DRAFT_459510 [Dactylonectria estremocensis]